MKYLISKPFFLGAALVMALSALISVAPVSADLDAWTWTDKSASLSPRDGVNYVLSAERQGSWLLSDGRALVRFDGTSVSNLSQEARDRGLNAIKFIASDDRQWLVYNRGLDDRRGSLWLRDGSSWTDLTNALPTAVESFEASGHDGQWYLNTIANGVTRLVFVNGTASIPQDVTMPLESAKIGHAAFVNGRWFWFGEQAGRSMVWAINETQMVPMKNVPAISSSPTIWAADASTLVAIGGNLYSFNGSTWTDLSGQAKALGLTVDGSLKAAYGGASWMIVSGKNLYRYDDVALASKGVSKDRILSVEGGNGFAVTAMDANGMAKLLSVEDAFAETQVAPAPIANTNVAAITAIVTTPALTVDASTGISYASWTVPAGTSLPNGAVASYLVAARDQMDGLSSIELWVNGKNLKTCTPAGITSQTICEVALSAASYPVGTDIFMNARIADAKGHAFWIPAKTLTRPNTSVATTASQTVTQPTSTTVFASRLTLSPDVTDIRRGGTLTVRAYGQDSRVGLDRIEISYGGQIHQVCRYGIAMSEVKCELTIDAASFADNTGLSFVARAINADGKEAWSNGRTVTIRAANWTAAPAGAAVATDGITRWSWMNPPTAQIESTQEATYNVGAWSSDGIAKIEMVVNGATRKTCAFVSGTVARDCAYTLRTGDWNHGQVVTVNSRITDMKGRVAWSDGSTVTISRAWWEPLNAPGPYVTVSASKNDSFSNGESLSYMFSGWSPNGADRLELYVNGVRVVSCPSDICRYTSPALTSDRVEYQARLVDRLGKETWSALYGLNKK